MSEQQLFPAYGKPVSRQLNVAVLQMASRLFPTGFDVASDAPDTLEKLAEHIDSTGRMVVWDGKSDQTIFADPEVNYAFRAWHDWHHWKGGLPFTPEGERVACHRQQQDIRALYGHGPIADQMCRLINAEIVGQLRHQQAWGDFPDNQAGFDVAYAADPTRALLHPW